MRTVNRTQPNLFQSRKKEQQDDVKQMHAKNEKSSKKRKS